jgi:DNA repair protein RadD
VILHDFQERFLSDIRSTLRTGVKSVLAVSPTGSGKTVVMSHIARGIAAHDQRLLIVVHRDELIAQTSQKLEALDVPHGRLSADVDTRLSCHKVVIATIQTAARRELETPDWLIYDECHLSKAKSWVDLRTRFPEARLLGFSATPCRLDGAGFDDMYQQLVLGPSTAELMERGFLARYRALAAAEIPDLSGVRKTEEGDYRAAELAEVMNTSALTGDIVEHWRQHASDRLTLVFAVNRIHARSLAERFRQAGVAADWIDGSLAQKQRKRVLKRFGNETRVLTSVLLFTEGWDRPDITALILARPTKSLRLHLQMIGRGLRTAPGKDDCLILDHAGNLEALGGPEEDRLWRLAADSPKAPGAANGQDSEDEEDWERGRAGQGDIAERDGVLREWRGRVQEYSLSAYRRYAPDPDDPAVQQIIETAWKRGYKPGVVYYRAKALKEARERYARRFGRIPKPSWSASYIEAVNNSVASAQ